MYTQKLILVIIVTCFSPTFSQQDPCANKNGFIRDPTKCDTFILCSSGTSVTSVACQPGFWFDEAAIRCRPETEVECSTDTGGGTGGVGDTTTADTTTTRATSTTTKPPTSSSITTTTTTTTTPPRSTTTSIITTSRSSTTTTERSGSTLASSQRTTRLTPVTRTTTRPTTRPTTRITTRPTTKTTTRPTTRPNSTSPLSTRPTRSTSPTMPWSTNAPPSTRHPSLKPDVPAFTPSGICANSTKKGSVAFAPYPGNCEKVVQCYFNSRNNVTLAVTRSCPAGHFWSQDTLTCVHSWLLQCPFNPCSEDNIDGTFDDGQRTVAMPGECQWYYKCHEGRAYPKKCFPGLAYSPGVGCILTSKCRNNCEVFGFGSSGAGIHVCDKLPNWNQPSSFLLPSYLLGAYPMTCHYGSFSILECRCARTFDLFQAFFGPNDRDPVLEVDLVSECSESSMSRPTIVPGSGRYRGVRSYRFNLNITDPGLEIIMESTSSPMSRLSVKRLDNRIILQMSAGYLPNVTAEVFIDSNPVKKEQESVEVTVQHNHDVLTLSASQGQVQHVTSVLATHKSSNGHDVNVTVEASADCSPVTKFAAFDHAVLEEKIWE